MRETLAALAAGEISIATAEARLAGYASGEAGRFDAAREARSGVPEAVFAEGKTTDEIHELLALALETTGRGLATRIGDDTAATVRDRLADDWPAAEIDYDERANVLRVRTADFEPPVLEATVGIVTAGTVDAGPAGEAAAVVGAMGATVERYDDVGVAGVHRLFDELDELRDMDVLVVAAGREGALPTVIAGLVDIPVIALPTDSGYGYGGEGEAALAGALQSCTALTTVNVDAGFVAGAQAGLIAQTLDEARK
ncbi:nickel pincer cofactor biosynthesis protein LarB [Halococcus thailandensis]|uniref:1-(5-phosphoribosyl)-5-amino-4-imidazole-carboxylate (AIR) carboxylase n=1 Tax=Halococcus thailandensis JCM 13552 TaxID=1227457 RepID=M0N4Q8_9EURY|nr:nickel pincer cofactor biosynthesis protein LarB [Halococcus thailandensis]EMA52871.1 1-(5-phosphoribosyl)-5-amino-4-imidazole- carboxylate (AIR) carboxylase [Halococcus thailandensis JCM 13552]